MKSITILDCYTDEPSGLGVPPYLGTYPRYLAGYLVDEGYDVNYMTIDDIRTIHFKKLIGAKTDIRQYNLTGNSLGDEVIAIVGVHTPGKYLSAVPGTLRELEKMNISNLTVTGPAVFGTQLEGGKFAEKVEGFNMKDYPFSYEEIKKYSILGAKIITQIPDIRIIEIESARGCDKGKCSFCTEPLKHSLEFRDPEDIFAEMKAFYDQGCRYFRIGKQSDFYAIPEADLLLKRIHNELPEIVVLHIDNVNPNSVLKHDNITEAIVKYCSSGNIAAFGAESFDPEVIKANSLNATPTTVYKAIKRLNEFGAKPGPTGMPKFLPGINIILGLIKESKTTLNLNYEFLKKILDEDLLLRRINIRQLAILPDTPIAEVGNKYLKKNKKHYWSFRDKIRKDIDFPMLEKVIPKGTILKGVRIEIHDGNTSFGRQIGTYPIIVGVKQKLELGKFYNIKVTAHMLRSITGEVVN